MIKPHDKVAEYLRRDIATISAFLSRFAARLQADPQIREEVEEFTKIVQI